MSKAKKRLLFTALLLLPIALITVGVRIYLAKTGQWLERLPDGRVIPVSGLKLNLNGLTNLQGDAKDDFRRLVGAIRAYADKYQRFPDDPRWLIEFTKKWPESTRVTADCFDTPDRKMSDNFNNMDVGFGYKWFYRSPRPDGKPRPVFPGPGERDVWLFTDTYMRANQTVYRTGSASSKPEGHYLVAWSDGKVEELPLSAYKRTQFHLGSASMGFDGEPGIDENSKVAVESRFVLQGGSPPGYPPTKK
jgi:hypothetical protein